MRGERAVYYLYAVRAPAPLAHGRDELQIGQLTPVSCGGSIYLCREHGARESTQARRDMRDAHSEPESCHDESARDQSEGAEKDRQPISCARYECEMRMRGNLAGEPIRERQASKRGQDCALVQLRDQVDAHRLEAAGQRFGW